MIKSMTGYGSSSAQQNGAAVSVEVRTVNHRFLDLHVRLGREYGSLESEIQRVVRSLVNRGRVDVNVTIRTEAAGDRLLDAEVALAYYEAARGLADELGLANSLDVRTLLTLPGVIRDRESVISQEAAASELPGLVRGCLTESLESVLQMRTREGEALKTEMRQYLAGIREKNEAVRNLLPGAVFEYRTRLQDRLNQLLPETGIDPQRLAQEIAILVERSDISEEVSRLDSHLGQFHQTIEAGRDAGKKMDFLLQEMQREVNTMLSKTGNLEVTRFGIAIKADIEKLREQAQNVE